MPAMKATEARILASLCRDSYADFVRHMWPAVVPEPLRWSWHIQDDCDRLQKSYERVFAWEPKECDRVTNKPPGMTKSIVHSVMSVPWAWTRMPHLRFLGASYSSTLSEKLSVYARDVIRSPLYQTLFPEVKIRTDVDTKGHYMTTAGGERFATGPGGSATGLIHAHVICLDDPINPEQALSDAEIYSINHWITHTLLNRKVDKEVSFVDMVGQRICQGDATDELLSVCDRVEHVVIPADADYPVSPPELVDNYVDGIMDPVRLPKTAIEAEKKKGESYYAGQFGQSPVPPGGGKFKTARLRWGPVPAEFKRLCRFWDKAASDERKRKAAWTVGVLGGEDADGGIWVLDVVRGRWDSARREQIIRRVAESDAVSWGNVEIGLEEEGGSAGKDAILHSVRRLHGHVIRVIRATRSKELRADAFSQQVNSGNVSLPERMRLGNGWSGWAKDFVDELKFWPFSLYLDQGDAASGMYTVLSQPLIHVGPLRNGTGRREKLVVPGRRGVVG